MENRNKRKGKRQQQQQFKSARSSASTRVFFKVFFCACCCWNADNGKMQAPFMRGKKIVGKQGKRWNGWDLPQEERNRNEKAKQRSEARGGKQARVVVECIV